MKNFIEVHDNILPSEFVDYLEHTIVSNSILPFHYVENLTYPIGHPNRKYKPGISYNALFDKEISPLLFNILYRFCLYKKIIVSSIPTARVFIDLPTPNPQPDLPPHIDSQNPHYVCLYYVNDADGDTIFFNDKKQEIKRVSPKKGRIAFFDGSIYHCGTPSNTKSRAVVNMNFTSITL